MVERDVSALKTHIDALRAAGVHDLDAYLRHNPQALAMCVQLVKVTDLNAAAMEPIVEKNMRAELKTDRSL